MHKGQGPDTKLDDPITSTKQLPTDTKTDDPVVEGGGDFKFSGTEPNRFDTARSTEASHPSKSADTEGSPSRFASASARLQNFQIDKQTRKDRITEHNLAVLQSISAYIEDMLKVVTNSNLAYDLRGKISEFRFEPHKDDPNIAALTLVCAGTPTQPFILKLDDDKDEQK